MTDITLKQAAELIKEQSGHDISVRYLKHRCAKGTYPGAKKMGRDWMVPKRQTIQFAGGWTGEMLKRGPKFKASYTLLIGVGKDDIKKFKFRAIDKKEADLRAERFLNDYPRDCSYKIFQTD